MDNLVDRIILTYEKLLKGKCKFTIGLSGGLDSVVLLHLFAQLKQKVPIKVEALHINHGISINADDWEKFSIDTCAKLSIPLQISRHIVTKSGGEGLENSARNVRYRVFSQSTGEVIVLAHHKNDQVETLLSQIMRGSDLHNIASMKILSYKFGKIFYRPLLDTTRAELELFAKANKIAYINDESNFDTRYLRNFVRHKLLPDMLSWDNTVINKLVGVTTEIQNVVDFMDEIGLEDLTALQSDNDKKILLVEKFQKLSLKRQMNLLTCYVRKYNLPLPSKNKILEFCRQVNQSAWDRHPQLDLNKDCCLYKIKDQIKIVERNQYEV